MSLIRRSSTIPYRRSASFKKRRVGRYMPRYRNLRSYSGSTVMLDRTFKFEVISGAFAIQPKLNQLPNYTEFTAMFDQYKIASYIVKIIPNQISADTMPVEVSAGTFATGKVPTLFLCNDKDGNGPSTPDLFVERGSQTKICLMKDIVNWSNRAPRIQTVTVNSTGTHQTAVTERNSVFLSVASPDTPHHSTFGFLDNVVAGMQYTVYVTVKLHLRGRK